MVSRVSCSAGSERICGTGHLEVMTRVRTIERLVAQGKVGDDVALDGGLEHRPLEPRGVAQMAALDVAVGAYPEPYEDVAAKPLDDRHSFARICRSQRPWPLIDRPRRKLAQDLLYQRQALLDFADADPDAGIDIAFLPQRRFELQRIVRRISWRASRIEASTRGAADITSAAELPRETWRQYARVDRPVLQRSGVVIELDQLRKAPATLAQQRTNERLALLVQIAPDPARHDLIHHKSMTEASIRRAQHLLAQVPALRVHHGKG